MNGSRRRVLAGLGSLPLVGCSTLGREHSPPRLPHTTRVSVPPVDHATLPHGPELRIVEDHGVPLVAMAVAVRAGHRHDPVGQEGLARLAASLLREGMDGGDRAALLDRYGELGATPQGFVEPSLLGLRCTVHADDAAAALQLLVDNLRRPTLGDEPLERLRREQRESVKASGADPSRIAGLSVVLGSTGLEPPTAVLTAGTPRSIAALQPAAVRGWLAAHVRPDALVVLVAGAVRRDDALGWVDAATRGWAAPADGAPVPSERALVEARPLTVLVPLLSLPQTIIAIGGPRAPYGHADEPAEVLASSMLGSLLHHELRNQQRTTYAVTPSTWDTKLGPVHRIETKVEPADVKQAIGGVLSQVQRLVYESGLVARALESVRRGATTGFMDDHHGADAALGQLVRAAAEGLSPNAAAERLVRFQTLAAEDVQVAMRRLYDAGSMRLGLVGGLAALQAAQRVLPPQGVVARRPEDLVGPEPAAAPLEPL